MPWRSRSITINPGTTASSSLILIQFTRRPIFRAKNSPIEPRRLPSPAVAFPPERHPRVSHSWCLRPPCLPILAGTTLLQGQQVLLKTKGKMVSKHASICRVISLAPRSFKRCQFTSANSIPGRDRRLKRRATCALADPQSLRDTQKSSFSPSILNIHGHPHAKGLPDTLQSHRRNRMVA